MDMELYRIQWRLNSQLFCKYTEVDGNGVGWNKWFCQPSNTAGKQQYEHNRYGNTVKRIYCIGRRHLRRDIKRQYLHDESDNSKLLGDSYIYGKPDRRSMRLIKWRDIHLGAYHQSLQYWYGNGRERQWSLDLELYRIQWRLNSQLFCKYTEVDGNGVGWNKWFCQPSNTAGKQQYEHNRYGNTVKRIYCIGRRHLRRDIKRQYLHDESDNSKLLGDSYIYG